MNKKLTALLLSGLVLPGLGQLYLGRKMVGGIIVVLVNLVLIMALFVLLRGLSPLIAAKIAGGMVACEVVAGQAAHLEEDHGERVAHGHRGGGAAQR